jgi:PAS domain S-box-containing protein
MGHKTLNQEVMAVTKNGTVRLEVVSGVPIYNAKGEIQAGFLVCSDITERKLAEKKIRESEERLRTFIDSTRDMVFLKDDKLRFIVANKAGQELLGLREEDILGKTDSDFVPRESARRWRRTDLEALAAENAIIESEDIFNGRMLRATKFRIDLGNGRTGLATVIRDVTEQRAAEEALRASELRYRELADNMPAGIYEATFEGQVIYANKTALDMFGYSADEVEKGVMFQEVIAPDEWETLVRHMQRVRQEGSIIDQEYTMLRRDGSRFVGLNMARPMIKAGRVIGSTGVVTDISDLKKAQESLRKNEALLQGILQAAPIGIGIVHDRVIGWVNEQFTRMMGYASEDVIGKNDRILYPDDGEYERVGREKYGEIQKGRTGAVETRWRRKDGTVFDIYLSSNAIDQGDLSAGIVFTAYDITDQKKAADILRFAKEELEKQVTERTRDLDITNMLLRIELEEHRKTEEALVKNEQLYRAIVEDQTELICRFNPDGTLSFVNEAFCRYFNKTREDLLGTRYRPPIPREDRDVMTKSVKALTPEHNVAQLEVRAEIPGQGLRWMLWTTRAIYDEVGRLIEHQAVGRDVTERVRAQHQIRESRNTLRSVFDGISDPLVMVGGDSTVIMLNKAALGYFDIGHYRELIGLPCLGHLIERYGADHAERVKTATRDNKPSRFDLTANLEAIRYEEVSIYPVWDVDDGKGLAIIRVTDRTKQVIMERELIQSEKLASLGLLIAGIVHEINNPNNFIVFNIPILRDYLQEILPIVDDYAEKNPMYEVYGMSYPDFRVDVMKLLDNIDHGSHRINITVAKLKEFSRKKEDKGLRPVASAEVINKALSICHTQIRKTVKTFDVEIDPGLQPMTTDPEAIEQVLINLLINAAQAADKEDSVIRLRVSRGDSWKNRLVMEVTDNGCGMDEKTASRIFDPFFTTKEEGCGTGLGLYISKNLVESAGGSISLESEAGRGTSFRVSFFRIWNPGIPRMRIKKI